MSAISRRLATVALLLGPMPAQQLQWQVSASGPPATAQYYWMGSFVDFDRDGYRDLLRYVDPAVGAPRLQVVSAKNGTTLWEQTHPLGFSGPIARYAGDLDGDGEPDLAIVRGSWTSGSRTLEAVSVKRNLTLWSYLGTPQSFGHDLLADLDVNGDGKPDVVTITYSSSNDHVYVFDTFGSLLYTIACGPLGRFPTSLCELGDRDGDGCDDFLIGCIEPSARGVHWLISGKTGTTIRETFGLLPGDHTVRHLKNLGDIDGDDVPDYAAFPWYSSQRLIAVAYSGATGAVIRSWTDYANSVVAGEDFDQDGVNDIVTGADWMLDVNNVGRTYCWSGRDGSELWHVDVVPFPTGQGYNGSNWMWTSASLGVQPGSPYPVLAWMDLNWFTIGTGVGRIRAFSGMRIAQGPVTGTACTSSGTPPLIGVRALPTGSRITVAKTHANAFAALQLAFAALPTPVDLSPFGFSSCTVYLDPAASVLALTGTTGIDRGYAKVDLPHPLASSAVGTNVVAQWLVYDPASLAYAATQLHALELQ